MTQYRWQVFLPLRMRQIDLHVRTTKCFHEEEPQRRNPGNDSVRGQFQIVNQMQVILPHVFFVELVRTLAEVSSEILHSVEVTLNGER